MSDKFLGAGQGSLNLSNGTATIYSATLGAASLDPSRPVKTNSVRQLVSSNIDITEVNNLATQLTEKDELTFVEDDTHTTPATGKVKIYAKTDKTLYTLDDTGTETQIGTSSTSLQDAYVNSGVNPLDATINIDNTRYAVRFLNFTGADANAQIQVASSSGDNRWAVDGGGRVFQNRAANTTSITNNYATANVDKFKLGMKANDDNFTIQNVGLSTDALTINETDDYATFNGYVNTKGYETGGGGGPKYFKVNESGTIVAEADGNIANSAPVLFLNYNKTGGISAGGTQGTIYFKGSTNTGNLGFNSQIYSRAVNNLTNADCGSDLVFSTTDVGQPYNQTPPLKLIIGGAGITEIRNNNNIKLQIGVANTDILDVNNTNVNVYRHILTDQTTFTNDQQLITKKYVDDNAVVESRMWAGSFGTQGTRYLEAGAGSGTSTQNVSNQWAPYKNIRITQLVVRKENASPQTDFVLYKSDLNFVSFTDLHTVSINSGQTTSVVYFANLTINFLETLFVRTSSSGSGNPQMVQAYVLFKAT